jgi:sulfite reductase alpha subunit-like flavoprotein
MVVVRAGMMPGILETLKKVAESKKLSFEKWSEKLKHENRFHVEVY